MIAVSKRIPRVGKLLALQDHLLVAAYFQHIVMIEVLLTAVAVTIDTGAWIARVHEVAGGGIIGLFAVIRFLSLRTIDNGVQALPVAAILGFVWSEVAYYQSGHRLLDRLTGRKEARSARPIFIAAAILALLVFALDNFARPIAVRSMIDERMAFWTRYMAYVPNRAYWFAVPGAIVRGSIPAVGDSKLDDVTYFGFDGNRPTIMIEAETLEPVPQKPGSQTLWRMSCAKVRPITSAAVQQPGNDMQISLAIDSDWLHLAQVKPAYLYVPELLRLASVRGVPAGAPNYRSWLLQRLTGGFALGLLCTFVALFFRNRIERGSLLTATALAVTAGYTGVLALRMLRVIGEYKAMEPVMTASIVPVGLMVLIGIVYRWRTRHDAVTR